MEKVQKDYKLLFWSLVIILIILLCANYIQSLTRDKKESNLIEIEEISKDENTKKNELSSEEQQIISDYLQKNISEISPEKEVLGGKFYITSLDFLDENNLVLGYEDGHIAFMADINFQYIDENNIIINKFEINNPE